MADATQQITEWYQSIAGKGTPDQAGLNYWTGRAAAGEDLGALKSSFTDSVNQVKANDVYKSVLGRDGDTAGVQFWAGEIAKGNDITSAFKDSAKEVYNDVLTNPNSVHKNASYSGMLSGDLNGGVTPGTLTGSARDVAKTGLESPIFKNLYGDDPKKTTPVTTGVTTLDPNMLTHRVINPTNETVRGQLDGLLADNSKTMVQAKYDAMRTAADRGMLNSTMAASAGEDALIRNALNIATPDAAAHKSAGDYNVALDNQAQMYNAGVLNEAATQARGFDYTAALNGQNNAHQAGMQSQQIASNEKISGNQLSNQMSIAQMQNWTDQWKAEMADKTSRYNTDSNYRQSVENNRKTVANNIVHNMELSPDRKAALLEAIGEGTAAKKELQPDGSYKIIPGTFMAGAIYVIDDVAKDLAPATTPATNANKQGGGSAEGGSAGEGGGDGGVGGGTNGSAGEGSGDGATA